jgi:hypothetical protein
VIINMEIQQYKDLMQSVSEFAGKVGLNNNGLYRDSYEPNSKESPWVISVSWRNQLSGSRILYTPREDLDPNLRFKLEFPIIAGTKNETECYRRRAEEVGAEYFLKQSISADGFVQPSPEFLGLGKVRQVEYALHEAFHATSKDFMGNEVQHLPIPSEEEAYAMVAGHLGAIYYFKGSNLESQAVSHWQKHSDLVNKIVQFYRRLEGIYASGGDGEGKPVSQEQILKEREIVLLEAREVLGNELGSPINNAFFRYWNYFYGGMPRVCQRVSKLENICDIVERLTGKRFRKN